MWCSLTAIWWASVGVSCRAVSSSSRSALCSDEAWRARRWHDSTCSSWSWHSSWQPLLPMAAWNLQSGRAAAFSPPGSSISESCLKAKGQQSSTANRLQGCYRARTVLPTLCQTYMTLLQHTVLPESRPHANGLQHLQCESAELKGGTPCCRQTGSTVARCCKRCGDQPCRTAELGMHCSPTGLLPIYTW